MRSKGTFLRQSNSWLPVRFLAFAGTLLTMAATIWAYTTDPFNTYYLKTEPYRPNVVLVSGGHSVYPLVAVWPDGLLVWAEHLPSGYPLDKPPAAPQEYNPVYFATRIDPSAAEGLLNYIQDEGWFQDPGVGPSILSGYGVASPKDMLVQEGGRYIWMHHYIDDDATGSRFMGEDGFFVELNGQTREQLLASESPEYQRGYRAWHEIRSRLINLIPASQDQWHLVGELDWDRGPFRPDPYAQSILPTPTPTPTPAPTSTPTPTGS